MVGRQGAGPGGLLAADPLDDGQNVVKDDPQYFLKPRLRTDLRITGPRKQDMRKSKTVKGH